MYIYSHYRHGTNTKLKINADELSSMLSCQRSSQCMLGPDVTRGLDLVMVLVVCVVCVTVRPLRSELGGTASGKHHRQVT